MPCGLWTLQRLPSGDGEASDLRTKLGLPMWQILPNHSHHPTILCKSPTIPQAPLSAWPSALGRDWTQALSPWGSHAGDRRGTGAGDTKHLSYSKVQMEQDVRKGFCDQAENPAGLGTRVPWAATPWVPSWRQCSFPCLSNVRVRLGGGSSAGQSQNI